ncbi:SF1B family DNA helicase RecD2 [Acinetobacter sp.]|uniref:SF1B family DNA helicase RecD2 n=1 Tax=Acinetobacter sp. TaxID=472 RepID=UPI003CFF2931
MAHIKVKGQIKDERKINSKVMRSVVLTISEWGGEKKENETWKLFGNFPGRVGDLIEGTVEQEYHRVYGYSLKAVNLDVIRSVMDDDQGFRDFLVRDIRGIGVKKADMLLSHFGGRDGLIAILDSYSSRLSEEIRGIGEGTAEKIFESWHTERINQKVKTFLYSLGLGEKQTQNVLRTFGAHTRAIIDKDTYRLLQVGIPFKVVDRIALNNGYEPMANARLQAGIMYKLDDSSSGSTYIEPDILRGQLEVLLDLNITDETVWMGLFEKALHSLEDLEKIVIEKGHIFSAKMYSTERFVARRLTELKYGGSVKIDKVVVDDFTGLYAERTGIKFTQTQMNAIYRSAQEGIMVITGGPGTGKTLTVGALVSLFKNTGHTVHICTPTGRSAQRITESTGNRAETIHRMLKPMATEYGMRFQYNEDTPLETDVVIVDEISMVDIELMASLLRAIPSGAKLILIGDKDQLPSIGAGNVLNDCLSSGKIPAIHLKTIFRQMKESLIITNAIKINQGDTDLQMPDGKGDFYWIKSANTDDMVRLITERIPAVYGINHSDIKVLTPFRREMVDINVKALNRKLQKKINPLHKTKSITFNDVSFRVGDPVMQLENNYEKIVFNGDIGTIENALEDEDGRVSLVVNFNDDRGRILYVESDINQLDLAYSFTIHKSQGSEYRAVIIILPTEYEKVSSMLKRNLLYTGVTRARELCIIMSNKASLFKAIKDSSYAERLTMLKEWIIDFDYKMKRKFKRKK